MSRGRSTRRVALATLLLAAGAAAVLTPRPLGEHREGGGHCVPDDDPGELDPLNDAGAAEAPSAAGGPARRRASRSDAALARAPRMKPSTRSDEAASATSSATAGSPSTVGAANASAADPAAIAAAAAAAVAAMGDAPLRGDARAALLASSALPATPERAAPTVDAPKVEPGRPPEIAFTSFVERGAAAVERVAQVVGERKPKIEAGVPVSLAGRVVEAEGGEPVEGARVVVTSMFYVRGYRYDHHLEEVARVETGRDGEYRIERLNADPAHFGSGGRFYVTVTADGHAPALAIPLATVSPGIANRLPDVKLARAAQTLLGRVLDAWEGKPVVGARVVATGSIDPVAYPKDEREALFVGAPTTTTDAEGRFVLASLGEGVQTISAHGGDDCVGSEVVLLPRDGEWTMRTRQIGGRIEGTIVDERGIPIALVVVAGSDNYTHSFSDGRFVLENFRGDVVTLQCTHADYAPVSMPGVANGAKDVVVRMERKRPTIVFEVVDAATSAPIPHVVVEFTLEDGAPRPDPTSPHHLAADGRYALRLPVGAIAARVSAEGRAPQSVPLAGRADGETVRVALAKLP